VEVAANLALRGSAGQPLLPRPFPPAASRSHSSPSCLERQSRPARGAEGKVAVEGIVFTGEDHRLPSLLFLVCFAGWAAPATTRADAAVPHTPPELPRTGPARVSSSA
jgi:hypothetical protein